MGKHDVLAVSYMRKDSQFLADGIWYVTTPCMVCGIVDEEVPWGQAKTPHHAGLIADQRHAECLRITSEKAVVEAGKAEIEAARSEVHRVEGLLKGVSLPAEKEKHQRGVSEAQKRLADTIAANRPLTK